MLEEIIFNEAIKGSTDILEDIDSCLFSDYQLSTMFSYIKWLYINGHKITYNAIRNKINSDIKIKNKGEYLDRIKAIEESSYYYISSLLDDFKNEYKNRILKSTGDLLIKSGTDQCTIDDAREKINIALDALDYGVKEDDIENNDELDKKIFSDEYGIKRIPLTHEVLKEIFGRCIVSRMYVFSGFPSMGKNIIIDNLVIDLAKNGIPGVYFSFDNSAVETRASLYSIETITPYYKIESREYESYEMDKLKNAKFKDNVHIVERKKTSKHIRRILQIAKKRYNIHWYVLDYFQNVKLLGDKDTVRHFEQAAIDLKTICTDLDITGIVLSQQNEQGSVKWCRGLFEEAFYLVKIDGQRESNVRKISIEKFKKGALKSFEIKYDASVGLIGFNDG